MSTEPKPGPAAQTAGPQLLLMAGVAVILLALGVVIWLVATGRGAAPANNVAEAAAPRTTPGGGRLLPSGLRIEIVREGTGPLVTPADTVHFRYELRKYGGPVIQSNLDDPEAAVMPVAGFVRGFQEGLTHMRAGGEARFWVPPYLGYGDEPPMAAIGPNDTLEFRVRLERIEPAAPSNARGGEAVPTEPAGAAEAAPAGNTNR